MATRGGVGTGVTVTIVLLATVCVGLFIATVVLTSRYQERTRELEQARRDHADIVRADERNDDAIRNLIERARGQRQSLVGYLTTSLATTMDRVTGSRRDLVEDLQTKLEAVQGAASTSLLNVIRERDRRIEGLQAQLAQAESARTAALQDLNNEVERVQQLEREHERTLAQLQGEVEQYKSEVDQYRQEVVAARAEMDARVERIREDYESRLDRAQADLREARQQVLLLQEQLAELRESQRRSVFRGQPEESLVDGRVIAATPGQNEVVIGLGRRDKIVLGMTFAVYSDASAVRPDPETGEYPRSKAQLEVISIDETSARCRITRETRGNPVVKGDVIANPVYDPQKVYKFVVYGEFDTDGDGRRQPYERDLLADLIRQWGGEVVDELEGDIDFLVLGQRPVVPPRPGIGQPIEVVREWMRIDQGARRYDQLLEQARNTSLPVLNQNRLYTLLGR